MDQQWMYSQECLIYHLINAAIPPTLNIRNGKGQTVLHIAAIQGNVELLRLATLHGADPGIRNFVGNTAIHEICFLGDVRLAKALLEPPTIQEQSKMPLQRYKYLRHRLLSCLDYYSYSGSTALHIAVRSNNLEIAKLLLIFGANVNLQMVHSKYTPLHIAVENNNRDTVKLLLFWDPDMHARTANNFTGYHLAWNRDHKLQQMLEKAEDEDV